jgi:hypothetical protein
MTRVYYIDVSGTAINGKRRQKLHHAYDGEKIIKIRKLTGFRNAGEIYIDSLFPEVNDEILELLKKGTKVYLLKGTRVLKKLRRDNNLRKSDEVDAQLLSMIPRESFRLLTVEEIEFKMKLRPVIRKYEWLARWKKTLKILITKGVRLLFQRIHKIDRRRLEGDC